MKTEGMKSLHCFQKIIVIFLFIFNSGCLTFLMETSSISREYSSGGSIGIINFYADSEYYHLPVFIGKYGFANHMEFMLWSGMFTGGLGMKQGLTRDLAIGPGIDYVYYGYGLILAPRFSLYLSHNTGRWTPYFGIKIWSFHSIADIKTNLAYGYMCGGGIQYQITSSIYLDSEIYKTFKDILEMPPQWGLNLGIILK